MHESFKGIKLLEHYLYELDVNFSEVHIIIGDLNARTSNHIDYINNTSNIPILADYDEIFSNFYPPPNHIKG